MYRGGESTWCWQWIRKVKSNLWLINDTRTILGFVSVISKTYSRAYSRRKGEWNWSIGGKYLIFRPFYLFWKEGISYSHDPRDTRDYTCNWEIVQNLLNGKTEVSRRLMRQINNMAHRNTCTVYIHQCNEKSCQSGPGHIGLWIRLSNLVKHVVTVISDLDNIVHDQPTRRITSYMFVCPKVHSSVRVLQTAALQQPWIGQYRVPPQNRHAFDLHNCAILIVPDKLEQTFIPDGSRCDKTEEKNTF
jgi:hypothetical protein